MRRVKTPLNGFGRWAFKRMTSTPVYYKRTTVRLVVSAVSTDGTQPAKLISGLATCVLPEIGEIIAGEDSDGR